MIPHTAEQVMTRDVVTVRKGASVETALALMARHHISGLPVVDVDDRLVGIVTERDVLLRGQADLASAGSTALNGDASNPDRLTEAFRKARAHTVEEAMTAQVISFGEHSSVADISRVMIERDINRVPITRDGKVVGMISRSDIIKSMAALAFDPDDPEAMRTDRPRIVIDMSGA